MSKKPLLSFVNILLLGWLYWVGKKFFGFFSKISWNGRERFRIFHISSI